jgi:hypothetical protein
MDRDPQPQSPRAAGILAVLGGVLVPTAVFLAAWALFSKPRAYQLVAIAVGMALVGGAFIAHASQLDREAQRPDR